MTTAIAAWGNSSAVRIPRDVLIRARLRNGDVVTPEVNERGNVELVPATQLHRSFSDAPYLSIESLFEGYAGDCRPQEADWGDGVGAEAAP